MFDGMSLFDSSITWNRQSWGVADGLGPLLLKKKIKDCIVVGVWNGGSNRLSEYFPQKPFESLPSRVQDSLYQVIRSGRSLFGEKIQSDNYLRFLVREVKPFIDRTFSTWPGRDNTIVAGSSMGGLMAWYAICEYPDVFGGAACLSTHWPGFFTLKNNPIPVAFTDYLHLHLPDPKNHKIYFDYGTRTLDSFYQPFQEKATRR
jgi:enterochelin esterase-like enzyme